MRQLSYEHEYASHGKVRYLAGLDVLKDEVLNHPIAFDFLDDRVPYRFDLRVRHGLLNCRPVSPELVSAVDDVDLRGEVGEVYALLHCGVTSANDGDLLALEESPVAYGAVAYALTYMLRLTLAPESAEVRAGSYDDSLSLYLPFVRRNDLGVPTYLYFGYVHFSELGLELLGVLSEHLGELRAGGVLDARPVLNLLSRVDLPASHSLFEQEHIKTCSPAVNSSRQARWARADDYKFSFFHNGIIPPKNHMILLGNYTRHHTRTRGVPE